MPRTYVMTAGAVIDAEGRTVVNGVVSIYSVLSGGTPIAPGLLRQADGSAWPIEGVKTDGNGAVRVLWPDTSGDPPAMLYADSARGRWEMPPADLSARLVELEENPASGVTDEQAAALERLSVVRVSDFGGTSVTVDSDGFPTAGSPADSTDAVLDSIAALTPGARWVIDQHLCWKDEQVVVPTDGITVECENGSLICITTHATIVTVTGSPTGGTFTLTFDGQTTAGIARNASAATVQTALEALSNLAPGDVTVTGSAGGPYSVTVKGILTASGAGLTGGTSPAVTLSTVDDGKYSSVAFTGDDVESESLVLRVANVAHRRGSYDVDAALVIRGDRAAVRGVDVDGSWQIGVVVLGTTGSVVYSPKIRNTQADGSQILSCIDSRIVNPDTDGTGDDGASIYSPADASTPCIRCGVIGGTVKNAGGRGLAILGGADCFMEGVELDTTTAAALYAAAETSLPAGLTYPVVRGRFSRIAIENPVTSQNVGLTHAAIMAISYQTKAQGGIDGLTFEDITIGGKPVGGIHAGLAILQKQGANTHLTGVEFNRLTVDPDHGNEVWLFGEPAQPGQDDYRIENSQLSNATPIPDAGTFGLTGTVTPEAVAEAGDGVFVPVAQAIQATFDVDAGTAAFAVPDGVLTFTGGTFTPNDPPESVFTSAFDPTLYAATAFGSTVPSTVADPGGGSWGRFDVGVSVKAWNAAGSGTTVEGIATYGDGVQQVYPDTIGAGFSVVASVFHWGRAKYSGVLRLGAEDASGGFITVFLRKVSGSPVITVYNNTGPVWADFAIPSGMSLAGTTWDGGAAPDPGDPQVGITDNADRYVIAVRINGASSKLWIWGKHGATNIAGGPHTFNATGVAGGLVGFGSYVNYAGAIGVENFDFAGELGVLLGRVAPVASEAEVLAEAALQAADVGVTV